MLAYKPAAFRPSAPSPALGVAVKNGRHFVLGQTFDQMLSFTPTMGDIIRLVFHTSSAYLGIWVGVKEPSGFIKYLGWTLGVGQAVGAVCDAISLVKRAAGTHPDEGGWKTPLCDYMAPTGLPMAPRNPVTSGPEGLTLQNLI